MSTVLTSWELSKKEYGSFLDKAKAEVAAKGADAYELKSVRMSTALEHEIARAEMLQKGGQIPFGEFFLNSETRQALNEKYLPLCHTDEQKASFVTGLQQTWHEVIHELTGEHVYEVDPNLARMLKHTSLRGVKAEDMRLPYKNICVTVPEDIVGVNLIARRGSNLRLRHFYITEDVPDPNMVSKVNAPAGRIGALGFTRGQGRKGIAYDENFEGRVWRVLCFSGNPGEAQALERITQYHIPLPNGATADEVIARMPMKLEGLPDVFRWVMNVAMYTTWPEADAEHVMANPEARALYTRIQKLPKGSKKDGLKERLRGMPPLWRIYLGRHLPKWESGSNGDSGSPMLVRTLVPGHWQRYWYGPRESTERVAKWKLKVPFWRGPLDAPESNPRHVLKGPPASE